MDSISLNKDRTKEELELTDIKNYSPKSPNKSNISMKKYGSNKFIKSEYLQLKIKEETNLSYVKGKTCSEPFKKINMYETQDNKNENTIVFDAVTKLQRTDKNKRKKYNTYNNWAMREGIIREYKCADCSYSSINRNVFVGHVSIHMSPPFKCEDCLMTFVRKTALVKHIISIHNKSAQSNKKFLCNICGTGFMRQCNRSRHYATQHGGAVTKHTCPYCCYISYRKAVLEHHILTHTRQRPYKCKYCDRAYVRNYSLRKHLTTHTTDSLFTCSLCKVKLTTREGIKQHLKNHKESLLRTKLNRQPEKYYRCALCQITYSKRINLAAHMRSHSRQYTCSHCGYTTNFKKILVKHIKSHLHSE